MKATKMKRLIILFFVAGCAPSEKVIAKAKELEEETGGTVYFRNGLMSVGSNPEKCDAVCGVVPEVYKNRDGCKVLFETRVKGAKAKEPAPPTPPVDPITAPPANTPAPPTTPAT